MNMLATVPEECELVDFKDLPIGKWFRLDLKGQMLLSTWKKVSPLCGADGPDILEQGYFRKVWWIKNYVDPETVKVVGCA